MRYLLIFILSAVVLNAKCYYLPCNNNIQMAEQSTKVSLESEYLKTNEELQKTILEYKNKIIGILIGGLVICGFIYVFALAIFGRVL